MPFGEHSAQLVLCRWMSVTRGILEMREGLAVVLGLANPSKELEGQRVVVGAIGEGTMLLDA